MVPISQLIDQLTSITEANVAAAVALDVDQVSALAQRRADLLFEIKIRLQTVQRHRAPVAGGASPRQRSRHRPPDLRTPPPRAQRLWTYRSTDPEVITWDCSTP